MARMERLFAFLQAQGIKNVELYGYPGNPFPNNRQGILDLRALGDKYGLRFPARHGSLSESSWDAEIAASKLLGQEMVGEGGADGAGGLGSYAQTLATATQLNKLGKRSVEAGVGPAYFHNHNSEFSTRFTDNGVLKSAWEIVMDHTDARYVAAQIDIGWAVCGASGYTGTTDPAAGAAYVNQMIQKFGSRIVSFHVKDMVASGIRPDCGDGDQRTAGQGGINFAPLFASAKGKTKYYYVERDPVALGGTTNFNPFVNTADSALALKGDPAPSLKAAPKLFPSVPKGTPAADNQAPIVVTNDGDAPLVIGNSISIADDDAADFAIVSENCRGKSLAPERELHDQRRLQADAQQLHLGRPPGDRFQQRRRRRAGPDHRRADAAEGARVPRRGQRDRDRRHRRAEGARHRQRLRRRRHRRRVHLHRREPRGLPRRRLPRQQGRPAQLRAGDRAAGLHPGRRRLRRHR